MNSNHKFHKALRSHADSPTRMSDDSTRTKPKRLRTSSSSTPQSNGCRSKSERTPTFDHTVSWTPESAVTITTLASTLPVAWDGVFSLKKCVFPCRMHILLGDESLVDQFMPRCKPMPSRGVELCGGPPKTPPEEDEADVEPVQSFGYQCSTSLNVGVSPDFNGESCVMSNSDVLSPQATGLVRQTNLRITQRMKLDPIKLDDVSNRIRAAGNAGFCVLLAIPTGIAQTSISDSSQTQRPLKHLITYLSNKDAAGVVLLSPLDSHVPDVDQSETLPVTGVLHAFPPSDFAFSLLAQRAVRLQRKPEDSNYLVLLLIRGAGPS